MKQRQASWKAGVAAATVAGLAVAVSTALAEPATVPTPVVAPSTTPVAALTSVASDSSEAVRAMVEKRLAPQVGELEDRLEQLRRQAPTGKPPDPVKTRIDELQQQVGAIRAKVDATSARLIELRASRQERRTVSLSQLEQQWGASNLKRPEVAIELSTHARRVARLERAKDVAEQGHDDASKERASKLLAKENRRHEAAMKVLVPAKPEPPASTTSAP